MKARNILLGAAAAVAFVPALSLPASASSTDRAGRDEHQVRGSFGQVLGLGPNGKLEPQVPTNQHTKTVYIGTIPG